MAQSKRGRQRHARARRQRHARAAAHPAARLGEGSVGGWGLRSRNRWCLGEGTPRMAVERWAP